MPISVEIVVAIIMGIASPSVTIWLTHRIKSVQEKQKKREEAIQAAPDIQTKLRDELREDLERQRERTRRIEDDVDELISERDALVDTLSEWKMSFYTVREEKLKIEYELTLVRQELEQLKGQLALLQQAKEQVNGITD